MAKVTTVTAGDLAFLPLQPNAPVTETLDWVSDLMQSQNGTEDVLQLQAAARQGFQYTFPEQMTQKAMGFNVQYQTLSKLWGIPVWTEATYVGAISNASTTLAVDTTVADYRPASLVFIWQDDSHYQVLDIDTLDDTTLNLLSGQTTNAYTGAYVMPMRVGRVVNTIQRKDNNGVSMTQILFRCDDNVALDAGSTPTQFLGDDLYTDNPLMGDDGVTMSVNTRTDLLDYGMGPVAQRTPWLQNRVDYTRSVLCASPTEVRAFKQWLARRTGKVRRFWEPSFVNDLRKQQTGSVTTTFLVARDALIDWEALPRSHVAFELDDGSWLVRTLTSITSISGTQVQLNFATSLAVSAARIYRVSWLGLKRLDTDHFELQWIGNGVMQCAMQVTEIAP